MVIALLIAFVLIIFLLLTVFRDANSISVFRVDYSVKEFDSDGNYWVRRESQDAVANSPEKAIQIVEENLCIQQERESTDLGCSTKEYSDFKVLKL